MDALALGVMRYDRRAVQDALDRADASGAVEAVLTRRAGRLAERAAGHAAEDLVDPEEARAHASSLVRERVRRTAGQIGADSRAAALDAIASGQRAGLSPVRLAREVRSHLGLTARDSAALARYRAALDVEDAGAARRNPARVDRMVRAYGNRLLRQRATNIARTELVAAANLGQQAAWEVAQRTGALPPNALKRWVVTEDERTCSRCLALDGTTVAVGADFVEPGTWTSALVPPLHPSCRCVLELA